MPRVSPRGSRADYGDNVTPPQDFGAGGGGSGTITQIDVDAPITATPDPITGTGTIGHADSGVTAATYGDSTHYPVVTVDAKGHVTAVTTQAVSGGSGGTIFFGVDPPTTPSDYVAWWNTEEGQLKVYYTDANTSQWVDASKAKKGDVGNTGPTGATGATGATGPTGPGVPTGGSVGQVLAKNSGTDYDTHWISAGSGGDLTKIATVACSGGETTMTFSSIPGTYSDLIISIEGRDSSSTNDNSTRLQINGDSTSGNYTATSYFQNVSSGTLAATSAGGTPC
jgi:hypothetical protein